MCTDSSSTEDRALCHFKFFAYREYRELRHLGGKGVHMEFAEQTTKCRELSRKGKAWFADQFVTMRAERDLDAIMRPFMDASGLTLEDAYEVFSEGEWEAGYGGLRHAAIVALTLALRDSITEARERGEWENAETVVGALRRISHNSRLAVADVKDLDLSGPCCLNG